MIHTREELKYYLEKDKLALNITRRRFRFWKSPVWRYQILLRKAEYYTNFSGGVIGRLFAYYYKFRLLRLGYRLGFSIPPNVFGPGLRINHHGLIVVNPEARVGAFCDLHQGVNIGTNFKEGSVPEIGSNVWIGPGAKIFGNIKIADGIVIGANSVVNKSFLEPNITIAGNPARKIKDTGNPYMRQ